MKLYTYCSNLDSEIKLSYPNGIKKEEYSYEDYLLFLEQGKKYYIHMLHYYYETDMSDYEEDRIFNDFSINYNNMIIKDNELFGALVRTSGMFPKLYIYKLGEYNFGVELEGGYNSNSYDWWYQENDLSNSLTLEASLKYILIKENITYDNNNPKKISIYLRDIINLTQKDFILENNKVVAINYLDHQFILEDKDEVRIKEGNTTYHLIRINKEFLDKNIFDVSYEDFSNNKYEIL